MELAVPERFSQSFYHAKSFLNETAGKTGNAFMEATEKVKDSLAEIAGTAVTTVTTVTGQAVNTVSATAEKAKGTLAETAGTAFNPLTETLQKAKNSLSETAGHAIDIVSQGMGNSVTSIVTTAEKAKGTLNGTASQAINSVTDATHKAVASVTQTAEHAKLSLEDSIQQAGQLRSASEAALQNAISSLVKDSIDSHPAIVWTISHPWQTLGMVLLVILLLCGLFTAVGNFVAEAGLWLLKSPLKLGQFLVGGSLKGVGSNAIISAPRGGDRLQRKADILARLEAIRQEQNHLLQELEKIFASDK